MPFLSVLPRAEGLYWALRTLGLCGVIFYLASGGLPLVRTGPGLLIAAGYAGVVGLPYVVARWRRLPFTRVFWPVFVLDISAAASLIHLTGGAQSSLFVIFYALVPFVAYQLGLQLGLIAAAGVTALYVAVCLSAGGPVSVSDLLFRGIVLWVITGAIGVVGRFVRLFAGRLLNAMDKLNERTSELESTHAQLETIYETSRSLAELMPVGSVIDRVLSIAQTVLKHPICEVYTWEPATGRLWLKGRVDGLTTERLERPVPIGQYDVFERVVRQGALERVVDRHLGAAIPNGATTRSQLVVPMISEGKLVGILNAESPRVNAFSEHDGRVLSILAGSTAMALVNADLHEQMETLIVVDELTGVYNYRYFRTRLEEEKRRAARYVQPLSLIMVDIDWFKGLNDHFGHQIGNVVLQQVAQTIGGCIRDVDTLARYGGEEFMIILPQTACREAHTIGERIREQIEKASFGPDTASRPIHLTVSVGVSCYPDNGLSEDGLVESVDQALYRAKSAGKNAIAIF